MAFIIVQNGLSLEASRTFFDPSLIEYGNGAGRVQLKPVQTSQVMRMLQERMPPFTYPPNSPQTELNWIYKMGAQQGAISYLNSFPALNYISGGTNVDKASHPTLSKNQDDTFRLQAEMEVKTVGGRAKLGFHLAAATSNIRSFTGAEIFSAGKFFCRTFNDTGGDNISALSTTVTPINALFRMEVKFVGSTNDCFVGIWTGASPGNLGDVWSGPTEEETVDIGSQLLNIDQLMIGDISGGAGKGIKIRGLFCDIASFLGYSTAKPTIYTRIDNMAPGALIDMSAIFGKLNTGNNGRGSVNVQFFASDTLLDPNIAGDRTIIDTGLNGTFLTFAAAALEADPLKQYLYCVFELVSDGEQTAFLDETALEEAGSFTATSAGGGDIDSVFKESGVPVIELELTKTLDITGNLEFNADLTGVQVDINIRKFSNDAFIESAFSGLVNFTADTPVTFATMNGGTAPTFTASIADDYIIEYIATHADAKDLDRRCGLKVFLIPLLPTVNLVTPGNGQVQFDVTPQISSDVTFARVALASDPWPAENGAFSVAGAGVITVTGLTNNKLYKYSLYARSGNFTSDWTQTKFFFPTDGAGALIKQILESVESTINLAGLENSQSQVVGGVVQIPPIFSDVSIALVKIFPDTAPLEPERSGLNSNIFRITIVLCERQDTDNISQQDNQLFLRERLQALFVGKRLLGLPEVYCQGEVSPFVLDIQEIQKHYNWISAITLEFFTLTVRG